MSHVPCFLYLVCSSTNVSIFHSTWLGTFWMTSYILGGEALNFFFSNSHQIFQTLSNKKNPHFQNFRNFLVHSSQHLLSAQHLMWMMEQLCSMELRELEVHTLDAGTARVNHSAHACRQLLPSYEGPIVVAKAESQCSKSAPSCLPFSLHTTKDISFSGVTV